MLPVELRQIDPARRRFRTYRMTESITLFGELCLVIEWGRLGGRARLRSETFPDARSLAKRRDELLARRRRHGYVPTEGGGARI